MEREVNIALSTDSNYLIPTAVAVKSILMHAHEDNIYNIYILTDTPLSDEQSAMIKIGAQGHPNASISIRAVGDMLQDVRLCEDGPVKGVTRATYFRFLLPDLINADRVLYMDCDTLVLRDVAEIYRQDIGDNYMAGVRDITGHDNVTARLDELRLPTLDNYVNAGVLLMNLALMRRDGIAEKMLLCASHHSYSYNDQDIINVICYEKIHKISPRYNIIVDFLDKTELVSELLSADYSAEADEVVILHYAGRSKPWYHDRNHPWGCHWWQVADLLRDESLAFGLQLSLFLVRSLNRRKKDFRSRT